jgi:LysM repeat protein
MGLWSSTFGGGNSFSQSVANVTTPNDGTSYSGGSLTSDSSGNRVSDSNAVVGNDGTTFDNVTGAVSSIVGGNDSYSVQSGDSLSAIAARNGTTVEALMAANPGITNANSIQVGQNINIAGGGSGGVTGAAPSGLQDALGYVTPVGIIGKLSGWANGLDPKEDATTVVAGRQVYTSADGMQYSYNFLGLPYEVVVEGDTVVDKLSKRDEETGLTGYESLAAQATANGNDDEAAAIMQEAADNAQTEGGEGAGFGPLSVEQIMDWAEKSGATKSSEDVAAMLADPAKYLSDRGMSLSEIVKTIQLDANADGTTLDKDSLTAGLKGAGDYNVETISMDDLATYTAPDNPGATGYDAAIVGDTILGEDYTAKAIAGEYKDEYTVDANDFAIDTTGVATGTNKDGTTNVTGEALNEYASQDLSTIIDTSTAAGKLLAQQLGEGNYVDSKSTILGQMDILSKEFTDAKGNPKIPAWAQGLYRNMSRNVAFNGITGTAATAAYANAMMEASLPMAKDEAKFFQGLTEKNLDNRQEMLINKATVLSNMDVENLRVFSKAASDNARNMLDFDTAALDRENEAMLLNIENRVQALFEDTKAENLAREHYADESNEMRRFYDGLVARADEHRANATNEALRFNAGETNDGTEFQLNNERLHEFFQAEFGFDIDKYVADWHQKVEETNTKMLYDAASEDVMNSTDLTTELLNRTWEDVDQLLDFFFKGAQTMEELDVRLLIAELQAQSGSKSGGILSSLIGAAATLGGAYIQYGSDARMKENIVPHDTLNGVNFYTWDWNEKAKAIGWDKYPTFGVIAQEVQKTHPDAVVEGDHGYLMVNYGKLKNEI